LEGILTDEAIPGNRERKGAKDPGLGWPRSTARRRWGLSLFTFPQRMLQRVIEVLRLNVNAVEVKELEKGFREKGGDDAIASAQTRLKLGIAIKQGTTTAGFSNHNLSLSYRNSTIATGKALLLNLIRCDLNI
jgi:hypothetical protein